jgi:hypothetical protein
MYRTKHFSEVFSMFSNRQLNLLAQDLATRLTTGAGTIAYCVQSAATIDPTIQDDSVATGDETQNLSSSALAITQYNVTQDPVTLDYLLIPQFTALDYFESTAAGGHAEGVFLAQSGTSTPANAAVGGWLLPVPIDFSAAGQVLIAQHVIRVSPSGITVEVPVD